MNYDFNIIDTKIRVRHTSQKENLELLLKDLLNRNSRIIVKEEQHKKFEKACSLYKILLIGYYIIFAICVAVIGL